MFSVSDSLCARQLRLRIEIERDGLWKRAEGGNGCGGRGKGYVEGWGGREGVLEGAFDEDTLFRGRWRRETATADQSRPRHAVRFAGSDAGAVKTLPDERQHVFVTIHYPAR